MIAGKPIKAALIEADICRGKINFETLVYIEMLVV